MRPWCGGGAQGGTEGWTLRGVSPTPARAPAPPQEQGKPLQPQCWGQRVTPFPAGGNREVSPVFPQPECPDAPSRHPSRPLPLCESHNKRDTRPRERGGHFGVQGEQGKAGGAAVGCGGLRERCRGEGAAAPPACGAAPQCGKAGNKGAGRRRGGRDPDVGGVRPRLGPPKASPDPQQRPGTGGVGSLRALGPSGV